MTLTPGVKVQVPEASELTSLPKRGAGRPAHSGDGLYWSSELFWYQRNQGTDPHPASVLSPNRQLPSGKGLGEAEREKPHSLGEENGGKGGVPSARPEQPAFTGVSSKLAAQPD